MLCLLSLLRIVCAHTQRRPSIKSIFNVENATIYSRDQVLKYDSKLELGFTTARTGPIQLELLPNLDLLHHGSSQIVIEDKRGHQALMNSLEGTSFKVFKGSAFRDMGQATVRQGAARILVHEQSPLAFEGDFTINHESYHVQLSQNYQNLKGPDDAMPEHINNIGMVLWSDADASITLSKRTNGIEFQVDTVAFCSTDQFYPNRIKNDAALHPAEEGSFYKKLTRRQLAGDTGNSYVTQDQLRSTIGQTAGCPKQREVAILGAAADCNFVQQFNSSASAKASIIAAFNSASAVYETSFNISLGLGQIVISDATCPTTAVASSLWNTACDDSVTIGDRLNDFSKWRGQQPDTFAAWSLLTTCNTGSEIGVAWLGTLCQANATNQTDSTVAGTNVIAASSSAGSYWRTIAHELGHNYGANHDCDASTCGTSTACCPLSATACPTAGNYLMNPSASLSASGFSPCTIGQVCTNIGQKTISSSCLTTNQNVKLEGAATCGNGIVEEGEECDCGGTAGCGNNTCCNPTTCQFTAGSVCDSEISACCTSNCQYASSDTICRPSTGFCDPAETCTGFNGSCPADTFTKNGQSCGTGLKCASGQCTSRNLQCTQQMNGSRSSCDDVSCALTCFIGQTCYMSNANFVTGTPCGIGGTCQTGICDEGSVGHVIESWFSMNKKWLIPVIAVVGGVIVAITLYCWITSCIQMARRKRSVKQMNAQMSYVNQNYDCQPPAYPGQVYHGS